MAHNLLLWAGLPPPETLGKRGKVKIIQLLFGGSEKSPYIWSINEQQHAMTLLETATRQELELYILSERSLYAKFNEQRLLDGQYTLDELREVCQEWVEDAPEVELV